MSAPPIDDATLDSAVAQGLISAGQAVALRQHAQRVQQVRSLADDPDDERLRLVTNFNDVFVVIACGLVLAGASWAGRGLSDGFGALCVAAVAWLLAELFVRRRRMALPAVALTLCTVAGVGVALGLLTNRWQALPEHQALPLTLAGAAAMAWGHWGRFKVPLAAGLAQALAVLAVCLAVAGLWPPSRETIAWALAAAGAVILALAMRSDTSDPLRRTQRADIGFWLHLMAAPLLMQALFGSWLVRGDFATPAHSLAILMLYLAVAGFALVIDRRAPLVAALGYAFFGLAKWPVGPQAYADNLGLTSLLLGGGLLTLALYWRPCRRVLLRCLPAGLQARVPPAAT